MPDPGHSTMGRVQRIHFVGIGGAGMSGIAEVLHNLGYSVSGSDREESAVTRHLQALGVRVMTGHDPLQVRGSDVIVVSSAVSPDNPEVAAARRERIPVIPRAEMLAELMRFRQGIAVAGTHGKTTTTSLIASVLTEAGLDPTYVIGGRLNRGKSNARLGEGQYLVAEADESDASFLHLQPVLAVLTNIDADHMETYGGDFRLLQKNFLEFLQHLPFYGLAVVCLDDPGVRDILPGMSKPFITYGLGEGCDYRVSDLRFEQQQTLFRVTGGGEGEVLDIRLPLPGRHNALNATAAVIVARELNIEADTICRALGRFEGIARRCDVHGEIEVAGKRALIIDDYAHHPREIRAILDAVGEAWPGRRIVTVFQPHRYSRTRDLFEDFCSVLATVEALVVLEVYAAGEEPVSGADGRSLCRSIRRRGKVDPVFLEDRHEVADLLPGLIRDADLLLTLGAGDVGRLGPELMDRYGARVH